MDPDISGRAMAQMPPTLRISTRTPVSHRNQLSASGSSATVLVISYRNVRDNVYGYYQNVHFSIEISDLRTYRSKLAAGVLFLFRVVHNLLRHQQVARGVIVIYFHSYYDGGGGVETFKTSMFIVLSRDNR